MTSTTHSNTALAIERERAFTAQNYAPLPVVLASGHGEWLVDADGKRYLDMMSAYSAVSHGHSHPRLIKTLTEQANALAVTSRAYHTLALGAFAQKLAQLTGLPRVLPANGGAESVETAIKAARRWGYRVKGTTADRAEIVVARNNFHGRSTTIVGFSTEASYRDGFGPFAPGFRHFDFGDITSLAAAINENTCAVLIEPIQGEAGIVVPPVGFLREVRRLCDERGVLLILDEIQSGLGRTGRWFAFQHDGIQPDGLILGKALGGGLLPVSCFAATDSLMGVFEPGSHGSTFGGNPLAAAVALEALRVIEDENLVARSAALGAHLLARLSQISSPAIRAVRGQGLWVGVDLDPEVLSARKVVERLVDKGVLSKETHETVIRFAPPLTISREALDWGIDVFIDTLSEFAPAPNRTFADKAKTVYSLISSKPMRQSSKTSLAPRTQLMMSAPDHFEVSYKINPWMDPSQWHVSAERLGCDARKGWAALRAMYEQLGAEIHVQPAQHGLPDMVFTANAGVVLDRKAVLARFRCAERQGEEMHNRAFFNSLAARGLIDSLVEAPHGLFFEGAGDAIWDHTRSLLWAGWGQRSSREMTPFLADVYGVPTVDLELIDPRFYHLDTCFCVMSHGDVLVHRAAFSPRTFALIEELVGHDKLIVASDEDAHHLAVNSVSIGDDLVLCHATPGLRAQLSERGYRVHVVPLDSFNRSGGAAYCLTLRLDNMTQRAAQHTGFDDGNLQGQAGLRVAA